MRLFLLLLVLLAGCSSKSTAPHSASAPQATPLLVLASNERGRPQFDYVGPGNLSYHYSFDSFTYEIGPLSQTPWVTAKGEMKPGHTNDLVITIQSESDRPYEIQLLGLSTNNNLNIKEEKLKETLPVAAGKQKLILKRYVIFTYDFSKS